MTKPHAYRFASIAVAIALVVSARAGAGDAFRPAAAATSTQTSAPLFTAAHTLDLGDNVAILAAKAARTSALRSAESPEAATPVAVTEASVPPTADSSAPAPAVPVTGPI